MAGGKLVIEKLINELVEDYTKNIVYSFKIVAGKAYKDGLRDGLGLIRQLLEIENTEQSTNVRDDDY